jgi:hypothetical protein
MSTEVVVILSENTEVVNNTRCHNPLCGRTGRHIVYIYMLIYRHIMLRAILVQIAQLIILMLQQ